MARQSLLFTVFPRAVSVVRDTLPVSVLVSPRLTGAPALGDFPDWLHWAQRLRQDGLLLRLDAAGKTLEARIDPTPLRPDLWTALFREDTRVDDHVFEDYTDRTVLSYPVRDAMLAVKSVYQQAGRELGLPLDPADREAQARRDRVLAHLVEGFQLEAWSETQRQRLRAAHGLRLDGQRPARRPRAAAPAGADGLPGAAQLERFPDDLQALKRQVTAAFALYSRMPQGAPIAKPDMATVLDFHRVIAALNAYPALLRAFGLVFDLDLPADTVPETAGGAYGRLSVAAAEPGWDAFRVETSAGPAGATAYQYLRSEDGQRYWMTAPGPQGDRAAVMGLLALDPDRFCLAQFDVDGAMHKLMSLAGGVTAEGSRLNRALHPAVFDDANTVPALRSAGLSLVQDERGRALLAGFAQSRRHNDRLAGIVADDTPFFAEDLLRGLRVDVWDADDGAWRSLHRRQGRYAFSGAAFDTQDEEGFMQLAATQAAPDPARAPETDLYLHEALARWNGWSLSVPPPGKALGRSGDPAQAVPPDDPAHRAPDDRQNEAVTPFDLTASFRVVPHSLPKLRFGHRYRLRARAVDLAGNSLPVDDPLGQTLARVFAIPRDEAGFAYLRYEPVPSPVLVRRDDAAIAGRGSALDRLVIRTGNDDPSKDGVAADTGGAQRHVAPPRTSIEMLERHGLLDDASGRLKGDAATYQALRDRDDEQGAQFPRAPVPGQREALPIVTHDRIESLPYLPDPLARIAAFRDLPGAPAHTVGMADGGGLHYRPLDDPNPRAGSVTLIPFETAPGLLQAKGLRLALADGEDPPHWDAASGVLTVHLPKGATAIVTLSSALLPDDLKLMGQWQWLREYLADRSAAMPESYRRDGARETLATLAQRVLEGGMWMLTPPTLLTLVSAVQQPIGRPRFEALAVQRPAPQTRLQPLALHTRYGFAGGQRYDPLAEQLDAITGWREPGALHASLIGALRVHGASTAKIDLAGEWEEWIDEPDRQPPAPPSRQQRSGAADAIALHDPVNDRILRAPGGTHAVGLYDPVQDLILFTTGGDIPGRDARMPTEDEAAPRHHFGDTRHRRVRYTATATSRYREYFPEDAIVTRQSDPIEVNIPASARPPLPALRYAIPAFGWERQAGSNLVRSVRYGGGVRVYLERPWYASGDGELLGVVLWQAGAPTPALRDAWKPFVTQWGRDPIWQTDALPSAPGPSDFPLAVALEHDLTLGMTVPAGNDGQPGRVGVAGHEVFFDAGRGLWFADIALDAPGYMPFVRLALARYQPNALADAKLSNVVLSDFVQLAPDRAATISADPYRPALLRVTVSGAAPAGPPPAGPGAAPPTPTAVRVRVQQATPGLGELGWRDVGEEVATMQADPLAQVADGVLWQGTVRFQQAPASGAFRLVIEEREYVAAGHVATGMLGGAAAGAGASAPGRIVYAEIVLLDDVLTLAPAPHGGGPAPTESPPGGGDGAGEGEEDPEPGSEPGFDPGTLARRVIVQLRDDVVIPYADNAQVALRELLGEVWDQALALFPDLRLDRLFDAVDADQLDTVFNAQARDLEPRTPPMQAFFTVVCPPGIDPQPLADALSALDTLFARVYVETLPPMSAVNFADDPLVGSQFYLEPAPDGFDAKYAWTQPGGDGQGVRGVDVEYNWNLEHEDLLDAGITFLTDADAVPLEAVGDLRDHGTESLGVMLMRDNATGGVGIVPRAAMRVASGFRTQADGTVLFDVPNAIVIASAALSAGDILLIELQDADYSPVENDPAVFAAIAAAVARGIIVVEPGGNGPGNGTLGRFYDLDSYKVPATGLRTLRRPAGLDSGAILVAACRSGFVPNTQARAPTRYTPRGARIDCFAYGEHVLSSSAVQPLSLRAGPGGPIVPNPFAGMPYTWAFRGTSSATALIAGAALSVQGMAIHALGRRLTPFEMRAVLSDRTLNTPSASPQSDRIGVMPNLRRIADLLNTLRGRGPVPSGQWNTVRTGHELLYLGRRLVLDWEPATKAWRVWPFEPLAIAGDPLPSPAVRSGTWRTIGAGHVLVYMGGDLVMDYVPATGDYRLFPADWGAADFLPGPPRAKGRWYTIRDEVVGGVAREHRLAYLGGDHVLDWVPQTRTYRIWALDRRGTRADPLMGVPVPQPDGTVSEPPLAEGAFPDAEIGTATQILSISDSEVLFWHAGSGRWAVRRYDRAAPAGQSFNTVLRSGTWASIRAGHVLASLGEPGSGHLLDWEPGTGKYRLFNGVPDGV
ncbi:hypothetical protein CAL14_02340 [Bordetella genomosp. 9]|uniref:S8 family serine peptidase n=1 Tax=Bordetella genomosp. 9 TaxID=1416803 RepID=UPI000A2910BA|nr:S8 family serine peptidase [Bordetella genomosp. 9]ARP89274.1 hypothetical protein CAL14_02340 [Bordetella genomosp. 9]